MHHQEAQLGWKQSGILTFLTGASRQGPPRLHQQCSHHTPTFCRQNVVSATGCGRVHGFHPNVLAQQRTHQGGWGKAQPLTAAKHHQFGPEFEQALKVAEKHPDLLDTFLIDSESRVQVLQTTADAEVLSEVAHSFKGSASNMGAVRLAVLCQKLESEARDKSPAENVRLVADISVEFAEIRTVYEDERQHATTH